MATYDVFPEPERSMWMKYKGNAVLSWNSFDQGGDDPTWEDPDQPGVLPFRRYNSKWVDLFISETNYDFAMKKAELKTIYETGYSGQGEGNQEGDDGEGMKLEMTGGEKVHNAVTIKGFIESDTWRNTKLASTITPGDEPLALSLAQKQLLLMHMAKSSGLTGPEQGKSTELHPIALRLNWGYTQANFVALLNWLTSSAGGSYDDTDARIKIMKDYMPGYSRTWNWKPDKTPPLEEFLTPEKLGYKGDKAVNLEARKPAERCELLFENSFVESIRMRDDSNKHNRIEVEIVCVVDTNNNRYVADGNFLFRRDTFSVNFPEIAPKEVS
jgi:hypothetical protein